MNEYRLKKGVARVVCADFALEDAKATVRLHPHVAARHEDAIEPVPEKPAKKGGAA